MVIDCCHKLPATRALMPRVIADYREADKSIMETMGEMGLLGITVDENTVAAV